MSSPSGTRSGRRNSEAEKGQLGDKQEDDEDWDEQATGHFDPADEARIKQAEAEVAAQGTRARTSRLAQRLCVCQRPAPPVSPRSPHHARAHCSLRP